METQVKGCGMDSDQRKAEKSGSEMLSFRLLQCKAETQEITSALISLFKCKHALLSSWQYVFLLLSLFYCLFVGHYVKEQIVHYVKLTCVASLCSDPFLLTTSVLSFMQ